MNNEKWHKPPLLQTRYLPDYHNQVPSSYNCLMTTAYVSTAYQTKSTRASSPSYMPLKFKDMLALDGRHNCFWTKCPRWIQKGLHYQSSNRSHWTKFSELWFGIKVVLSTFGWASRRSSTYLSRWTIHLEVAVHFLTMSGVLRVLIRISMTKTCLPISCSTAVWKIRKASLQACHLGLTIYGSWAIWCKEIFLVWRDSLEKRDLYLVIKFSPSECSQLRSLKSERLFGSKGSMDVHQMPHLPSSSLLRKTRRTQDNWSVCITFADHCGPGSVRKRCWM